MPTTKVSARRSVSAHTKKTKKTKKNKRTADKTASRNRLHGVPLSQLEAEIKRRERRLETLHRQRRRLLEQLETLEVEIADQAAATVTVATSSPSHGRDRKRPKNTVILVDALRRVLNNRTLSVSEAAGAVRRAGYRTSSENFRTIVNQTLIGNRKTFRKVSRGKYTVRK